MKNKKDQFGTPEWLEENNRRIVFQQHMYNCSGRSNPDHPMHSLFTGLWQDFCLNEAGIAQRDQWFDRMQFINDVQNGKIKMEKQIPSIDYPSPTSFATGISGAVKETLKEDPIDDYLNCSAECEINDQECEDACVEELKQPLKENLISQADSPHQAAISHSN